MKRRFQFGLQGVPAMAAALVFILLAANATQAQIFHLQAGSSSLVHAHGGSVGFQAPGYEGAFGFGFMDSHFRLGGVVRTDVLGHRLTVGDDTLRFGLPTDIFNESQYFFGRGVGLSKKEDNTTWSVFAGTTSTIIGTPFFQAAKSDTPFGLLFVETKVSPRVKFFSRNVLSENQTFINGFEYEARPWLKTAVSGGIGANARYAAVALVADRRSYTVKASYVDAARQFRRVSLEHPLNSEVIRENLSFDYHPNASFGFTLSRQHYLAPLQTASASQEALVNHASVSGAWLGFHATTSVYASYADGQRNLGYLADASRLVWRHMEAGFNFNRNEPQLGKPTQTVGGRIREIFNRRFSLTQYASYSAGQTAFNFGGEFNSDRISASVSHAVTYAPFRPASAGGPFVNVYNVSLRIRLSQQLEIGGQSNVAP
ncbi:MAG: hypothetical protein L0Z53_13515, partial [Acidobacteriales bacterium]|nr:hypothetical protein [Terriglobales bacterium]